MHLAIAFGVLTVLLIATWVIWRASHVRAARARIEPMQPTMLAPTRSTPEDLRAAIHAFCSEHPGLRLDTSRGTMLVLWRLPPEPGSIPIDRPVDRNWSVELKLAEDGTVLVRFGECVVRWTHMESEEIDVPSLHRVYDWRWNMLADFEAPEPVGEETVKVPEDAPYTNRGLVVPLRRLALSHGWAWQPTLDVNDYATAS